MPEGISCMSSPVTMKVGEMDEYRFKRIPLVSATGSTQYGQESLRTTVAATLWRVVTYWNWEATTLLVVTPSADLDVAWIGAAVFGAVGTCGQRCTSTRRMIIHEAVYDAFTQKYELQLLVPTKQLRIGEPTR